MAKHVKQVNAPKADKNVIRITSEMRRQAQKKADWENTNRDIYVPTGYQDKDDKDIEARARQSRRNRRQTREDCRRYEGKPQRED